MDYCEKCDGPLIPLGVLGTLQHYRCRNCGWVCSLSIEAETLPGDDVSEFDSEEEIDDEILLQEREDNFRDDVEADADVLRMAGYGTDEDYGYYGAGEYE